MHQLSTHDALPYLLVRHEHGGPQQNEPAQQSGQRKVCALTAWGQPPTAARLADHERRAYL